MDLQTALLAVDETMQQVVASSVDVLRKASRHILSAGGKRARPRLAFLSYQAVGGTDLSVMVPIAAALEIVHTATLVHDDINDHGTLRRGRPTVNAIWGRTFALLTGDYLFAKVYELMAPQGDLNTVFAEATVKLVEGETMQAQAAKDGTLDQKLYFEIVAHKTAALFAAATKLGALRGGGPEAQVQALADYGFNVGMAFQIIDDILDLLADSEQLGKTAGVDVAQGKGIAVAAQGRDGNNGVGVATLEAADGKGTDGKGDTHQDPLLALRRDMLQGGAVERGQKLAHQFVTRALDHLDALPHSAAVAELQNLAWAMIERDY